MVSPDRGISGPHLARLLGAWRSSRPGYVALAGAVRLLVLDGRLPLRTRLPGERELAAAVGVSRTTATAAYAALREEGFLASRRGAGSWTCLPADRRASPRHRGASGARGRDRPQLRGYRRAGGRAAPRARRGDRRAPAAPARAGLRRARPAGAAFRRRRAPDPPRRRDLTGSGARHRRRAARLHAPPAGARRARRPRARRPPDLPQRAGRDPRRRGAAGAGRAAPRRLGPRDARGDTAAGRAAADLPDRGPPQPDRPDAAGRGARAPRRARTRDAHPAGRRRDDRGDPARRRRGPRRRRWPRTTPPATP